MRKVLVAILVLVALGLGTGIYFSQKKPGDLDKPADFDPKKPIELKFSAPEGVQFNYNVNIEKTTEIKGEDGKMVNFGVSVDMIQSLLNTGPEDKGFNQFMMDLFKDIKLKTARRGDAPLEPEVTRRQLDAERTNFSRSVYVYNTAKMLPNGLPVETPEVQDESRLVSMMLVYMQYFPGKMHTIGETWTSEREMGKFKVAYEHTLEDVVWFKDKLCARIEGTVKVLTPLEKVEIKPTVFKLWMGVEDSIIYGSEIHHDYRTPTAEGGWARITMKLTKDLEATVQLPEGELSQIRVLAPKMIEKERELRNDKRERSKDPENRAFFGECRNRLTGNWYMEGSKFFFEVLQ